MQKNLAIKWIGRILTSALSFAGIIALLIWYLDTRPYNDILHKKKELSDGTWLYITEYNGAFLGAIAPFVFRYYLDGKIEGDPMLSLKKETPFLTADTDIADISAIETPDKDHLEVKITMQGKIYDFTSTAYYKGKSAQIYLNTFPEILNDAAILKYATAQSF